MDSTTYSSRKLFLDACARILYTSSGHYPCNYSTKSVNQFITDIESGDMILVEFPILIEKRYNGGVMSFQIKVTNMRTSKTLSMKSTELYDKVLCWLKDPIELNI